MGWTPCRKVWEWIMGAGGVGEGEGEVVGEVAREVVVGGGGGGLGQELERVPGDVVMMILRRVGPRECARMCCLNKSWRSLLLRDSNSLWIHFLSSSYPSPSPSPSSSFPLLHNNNYNVDFSSSVFFAENHLRSGYPLRRTLCASSSSSSSSSDDIARDVSFMRIYGERSLVPGSVIVDGGSGYCKFGWSKYVSPSGRSATFPEFGNIESPMYSRLRHFFATMYNRMHVKASAQPIVLSLPLCHYDDTESAKASRKQLKEAIYTALFDMNVPAVCAINQDLFVPFQFLNGDPVLLPYLAKKLKTIPHPVSHAVAVLALFAAQRTSGIVVNVGFHVTSVVPILHGKVMRKVGVEVTGVGALKVAGFLREQMQQNNINFESRYTVHTLKENLCYVAADYEAELSKDTKASLKVPEGVVTLSKERFKAGEILFQPRLAGIRTMSLHQAVALCMDHCHAAELTADESWFQTVVLSGGTACLPGLAERLEKELHGLVSFSCSGIRVIPPPHGTNTAWFGAKLISNLSSFPESWCVTKKHFKKKPRFNLVW